MIRKVSGLVALLALVGLVGCGGSSAVEGIVTLEGTPVPGATVTFQSTDGKGQPGTGLTDANGNFTISSGNKKGLAAGTYKVIITKGSAITGVDPEKMKPGSPDYEKMMKKSMGGKEGPMAAKAASTPKSELPAKYAVASTTPFEVTVPLKEKPLKLDLKK
jgi:hypothetical protein